MEGIFGRLCGKFFERETCSAATTVRRRTCVAAGGLNRCVIEALESRRLLAGSPFPVVAHFGLPAGPATGYGLIADRAGNLYGYAKPNVGNGDTVVFELIKGHKMVKTLASFAPTDGMPLDRPVMDAAGNLYGTTTSGGSGNDGIVFELAKGTRVITQLAAFSGESTQAGLFVDSAGNLYGTTMTSGANNDGTVYEVKKASHTITTLASSTNEVAPQPTCDLVMDSAGNLYGTSITGGARGAGTIFELQKGSSVLTTFVSFDGTNDNDPFGGLVMDPAGDFFGICGLEIGR